LYDISAPLVAERRGREERTRGRETSGREFEVGGERTESRWMEDGLAVGAAGAAIDRGMVREQHPK
jgi:hypothetical protein